MSVRISVERSNSDVELAVLPRRQQVAPDGVLPAREVRIECARRRRSIAPASMLRVRRFASGRQPSTAARGTRRRSPSRIVCSVSFNCASSFGAAIGVILQALFEHGDLDARCRARCTDARTTARRSLRPAPRRASPIRLQHAAQPRAVREELADVASAARAPSRSSRGSAVSGDGCASSKIGGLDGIEQSTSASGRRRACTR